MTRVLAICPHPDDESIGCGGTLRAHAVAADEVRIVFLTSGECGGHGRSPEETIQLREEEARKSSQILGACDIEFWHQPDGRIRVTPTLVRRLHETLRSWRPAVVYVPHQRDGHADHRAAARLVRQVMRTMKKSRWPEVLQYEVWTPLERFEKIVDIGPHVAAKMAAIRAHASQCEVLAFDEAALGLARWRGEMFSWPEGEYAEVFARMTLR